MKCVILAGGFGTRLSEETTRIPKPMVHIGSKPIIWHIMKIYSAHGITEFIVCLGYKGYVIKEYFANYRLHNADLVVDLKSGNIDISNNGVEPWRVTLIDTGEESMTGGRLRGVMPLLRDEKAFCLTYGDGVSDVNIADKLAFHEQHGKLATVTGVYPLPRFGQLRADGAQVHDFVEKPNNEAGLINGGFFVLSPEIEKYLEGETTVFEHEPIQGLAADGELMVWKHRGFWQPMDTLRDAQRLRDLWDGGKAPWKIW